MWKIFHSPSKSIGLTQDISNIRNAATLGPLLFSSMHGGQTTGVDGEFGQAQPFGESSRSSNHLPPGLSKTVLKSSRAGGRLKNFFSQLNRLSPPPARSGIKKELVLEKRVIKISWHKFSTQGKTSMSRS